MADALADALIALGGNVGDVRSTFDRAVAMLCDGTAVRLIARSSDYRTPPWGVTDQPAFVNAVIAVATSLAPHDLFARALAVERALGRDRSHERRWGPRTIDLDLLAYDDLVVHDADLTLPHPRLFERAFVLVPLAEIAPDRVIAGIRVRDALARLDTSGHREAGAAVNSLSPHAGRGKARHAPCRPERHGPPGLSVAFCADDGPRNLLACRRFPRGHAGRLASAGRRRAQGRAIWPAREQDL